MLAVVHEELFSYKIKGKTLIARPSALHKSSGFSWIRKEREKVDVKSNTRGWNQTCKNLIRFLQDRISNKRMRRVGAEMKFSFTIIQIQIKLTFFAESTFGVKLREENREKREKLTWKVSWNSCFVNSYLTKRWNGSLISSSKQVVQIVKFLQKYFLADPFNVAKELLTNSK